MAYQPSSMVLFLTNCSLTKAPGGGAKYDESVKKSCNGARTPC